MSAPQVKLVFLLRRRPELTREAFQAYWRERHAPLVAGFAQRLNVRRYTQSHTITTPLEAAVSEPRHAIPADFDGLAELWWDDEAAVGGGAPDQIDAARTLLADEAEFIDLARSILFFTHDHVIVGSHGNAT